MPVTITRIRGGKEISPVGVPDGLPPAEREFVIAAHREDNRTDGKFSSTRYGHAALTLAVLLARDAQDKLGEAEILARKKEYVAKLMSEFGPEILANLKDDLKAAFIK